MILDAILEIFSEAIGSVLETILTPIVTAVLIHSLTVAGVVYSSLISLFFGGFVSFWMTVAMLIGDENPYNSYLKSQITILLYYATVPINVIGWLLFFMGG